jgi:hypothetical protein
MKLDLKMMDTWIPYTRVPGDTNLTYTNIYDKNKTINEVLWGPNLPSPGDECVHCTYDQCTDDDCGLKRKTHICTFPAGAPVQELQGLCPTTGLGKRAYFSHSDKF